MIHGYKKYKQSFGEGPNSWESHKDGRTCCPWPLASPVLRLHIKSAFCFGPSLILNNYFSCFPGSRPNSVPWLWESGPSHFLPIFWPANPNCFRDKSLHLSPIPHGWDPICYWQHALVLCSAHLPGSHLLLTYGPPFSQPPACLDF